MAFRPDNSLVVPVLRADATKPLKLLKDQCEPEPMKEVWHRQSIVFILREAEAEGGLEVLVRLRPNFHEYCPGHYEVSVQDAMDPADFYQDWEDFNADMYEKHKELQTKRSEEDKAAGMKVYDYNHYTKLVKKAHPHEQLAARLVALQAGIEIGAGNARLYELGQCKFDEDRKDKHGCSIKLFNKIYVINMKKTHPKDVKDEFETFSWMPYRKVVDRLENDKTFKVAGGYQLCFESFMQPKVVNEAANRAY